MKKNNNGALYRTSNPKDCRHIVLLLYDYHFRLCVCAAAVKSYLVSNTSLSPPRWALNLRHGEGTLLHADGSIFRGRFHRDKITGPGTVTSLDGSCYEGVIIM